MNRKGNIDILFIVVFLMAFTFAIIVGYKVFSEIGDVFVEEYPNITTVDLAYGVFDTGAQDTYFRSFNTLIIFIFLFGVIAALIAGFFVDTHPVLAVVAIFLMIIFTLLSAFMSNVYGEFILAEGLEEEVSHYPAPGFFFQHLPKFMVLATALVIIVTYGKTRAARGGI